MTSELTIFSAAPEMLFLLVLSLCRAGAMATLAVLSLRVLRTMENSTGMTGWVGLIPLARIKKNHAAAGGLMLLASAGLGMALMSLRYGLIKATGGSWRWFLLYQDPDIGGEAIQAVLSTLVALGGCLLALGIRSLVTGSSGRAPLCRSKNETIERSVRR